MDRFATTARPYCAAFMLIERDGKYLFVRRKNTGWMDGYYGLPSGKVEKKEGFLAAAVREAKEEVGVVVKPENTKFKLAFWLQVTDEPKMEWCNMVFLAEQWAGEPYNAEPDVHEHISWFGLDELPENVIPSVKKMLGAIQSGEQYGEQHVEK
ncbi:NUDIX domain-containing protein [Candidatus Saccharibacteria bacterium]|nr:MAG: NUDIX domain-containing protein [Candidatus Saccharibacteria bacterium]